MHLIRTFERKAAEVSRARRFVADALERAGREPPDEVMLVTSELVSNAVIHGADPVEVHLQLVDDALHLEVHDAGGAEIDVPSMPGNGALGGRGLPLVAALARSCGSRLDNRGHTTVWAELPAPAVGRPRVR